MTIKKILVLLSILLVTGCNKNTDSINNQNIENNTNSDDKDKKAYLSNSFYLDDNIYVFPFTSKAFVDNGWESDGLDGDLKKGSYKELSFTKDGYKEIRAIAYNDTDVSQKITDTNIHYIAASTESLGDSVFSYYGEVLGEKTILFKDKEFNLDTPDGKISEYENEYEDRVMYALMTYDKESKFKSFEIMSQEFRNVLNKRDLEDLRR